MRKEDIITLHRIGHYYFAFTQIPDFLTSGATFLYNSLLYSQDSG